MNYESLIFDIDGTLWDSRGLVAEGYNVQLRSEGLDHLCVDEEKLKQVFGLVMSDIADILLGSLPRETRYDVMERCMDNEIRYLWTNPCEIGYPGVTETVAELAKKYRIFVVSNSQCGYPEVTIDKLGLKPYVEGHLCFGDTGTSKGQTILRLMREHNIRSAVYIGDTQGDYEATREAGIDFVWCSYGFGTPEGYTARVDSFPQLLEVL